MYTLIYMYTYIHMYVYMHMHIYIYIYTHMYIYTCITETQTDLKLCKIEVHEVPKLLSAISVPAL